MFGIKESGQGLLEYALIISLVAIIVIIAVAVFGESLLEFYQRIIDAWPE